jgi:hypothetical protein
MATVINNPADRERIVESSDTGGWAVAVIVLLAVVAIGAFVWMRYGNMPAATQQTETPGSANINVTLPTTGGTDNSGSSGENSSGGTSNTPTTNTPAAQ